MKTKILLLVALLALPLMATATAPVITTDNATEASYNSVKLNGQILDHGRFETGYYNQSQVWFEYGPTIAYGSQTQKRTIVSLNSVTQSVGGLSQCSTYHFRMIAENESEKSYGQDRVFTTLCQTNVKASASAQNLTQGGAYSDTLSVKEGDIVSIKIVVESTGSSMAKNVSLKAVLPASFVYNNNLSIAGVADGRDITATAISLGDMAPQASKTIVFQAKAGAGANLPTGVNTLLATILVYTTDSATSLSYSFFQQGTGLGNPTNVNTGIVSDIAYSILLPLFLALLIVFILKAKIIGFDKVLSDHKVKVDAFRGKKQLKKLIAKRKRD